MATFAICEEDGNPQYFLFIRVCFLLNVPEQVWFFWRNSRLRYSLSNPNVLAADVKFSQLDYPQMKFPPELALISALKLKHCYLLTGRGFMKNLGWYVISLCILLPCLF